MIGRHTHTHTHTPPCATTSPWSNGETLLVAAQGGRTVEGKTLARVIREDGWEEAQDEGHRQGTQQTHQTLETTPDDNEARRYNAALCAAQGVGP